MNSNGFQNFVNRQPAPAEPGDYAGTNIRTSVDAGPGGFVSSPAGLTVGVFAWGDPVTGFLDNFFKPNSLLGFVHRENQGIIIPFLQAATLFVQPGLIATALSNGDVWALFASGGVIGDLVYARATDGAALAASDLPSGAANVIGFSADISTAGVLNVTVDGSPATSLAVGMVVTGASVPPGSVITAVLTGAGGIGTYQLSKSPAVAITTETMNAYQYVPTRWSLATSVLANSTFTGVGTAAGVMTASGASAGQIQVGDFVTGAGIPANTYVQSQLSGTPGGNGTYQLNTLVAFGSTTVTLSQGQLGKITTWQG